MFRLCRRFNYYLNFSDNFLLFKEITDLWVMHLPNKKLRFEIAVEIAEQFSLSKDHVQSILNVYKPEIVAEENMVKIGRAKLNRNKNFLT